MNALDNSTLAMKKIRALLPRLTAADRAVLAAELGDTPDVAALQQQIDAQAHYIAELRADAETSRRIASSTGGALGGEMKKIILERDAMTAERDHWHNLAMTCANDIIVALNVAQVEYEKLQDLHDRWRDALDASENTNVLAAALQYVGSAAANVSLSVAVDIAERHGGRVIYVLNQPQVALSDLLLRAQAVAIFRYSAMTLAASYQHSDDPRFVASGILFLLRNGALELRHVRRTAFMAWVADNLERRPSAAALLDGLTHFHAWTVSGLTQADYAAQHNVSAENFRHWRRWHNAITALAAAAPDAITEAIADLERESAELRTG